MTVPSGFAYSGLRSHVLLAACQPDELAHEHRPASARSGGEDSRGLFTLHLLHCLREALKEKNMLTYASLARGLYGHELRDRQDNPGPLRKQRPHCEGANQNRLLFTTTPSPNSDTFTLKYDGNKRRLYVEAGTLYGVQYGTKFTCPSPDKGPLGYILLSVTTAKPLSSTLDAEGSSVNLASLHGLQATVVAWNSEDACLKVYGLDHLPKPEGGGQFSFVMRETSSDADISCAKKSIDQTRSPKQTAHNPRGYDITRNDPLISHFGPRTLSIDFKPDAGFLSHIAKFNFHLYRSHQSPDVARQLKITTQLHRLKEVENPVIGKEFILAEQNEDLLGDARATVHILKGNTETSRKLGTNEIKEAVIADMKPYYGLTLINNSKYDLFPYVFYFDPRDYSITARTFCLKLMIILADITTASI